MRCGGWRGWLLHSGIPSQLSCEPLQLHGAFLSEVQAVDEGGVGGQPRAPALELLLELRPELLLARDAQVAGVNVDHHGGLGGHCGGAGGAGGAGGGGRLLLLVFGGAVLSQ